MRRPTNRIFFGVTLAVAAAGALLFAQQKPKSGEQGDLAKFTADTRLVVCNTTVVDKSGHLVTDLSKSNFTVLENGQQKDGSVVIPLALRPYIDGRERIEESDKRET